MSRGCGVIGPEIERVLAGHCMGLMMPCDAERRTAGGGDGWRGWRPASIAAAFYRLGGGRTSGYWPRCARWCCRRLSGTARSRPGHRRHELSQAGTAFGRRGAAYCGQLGSRTIAKWRYRCRWPIAMRACRSPTGCICRRSGRATVRVGAGGDPEEIASDQAGDRTR